MNRIIVSGTRVISSDTATEDVLLSLSPLPQYMSK